MKPLRTHSIESRRSELNANDLKSSFSEPLMGPLEVSGYVSGYQSVESIK